MEEEEVERTGSVLLRAKEERGGGESVEDGRIPLGFSLEVGAFGFNGEGIDFDDCAVIVVVVPNDDPCGLTVKDAAGLPDMVDIRNLHG